MRKRTIIGVAVAAVIAVAAVVYWQRDPVGVPSGANSPIGSVPHVSASGPPPAYIEFGSPGRWLARGTGCWTSGSSEACADYVDPPSRTDLPKLVVAPGAVGRIHLGFAATHAELSIGGKAVPSTGSRTITFSTSRVGIVELFCQHGSGDTATYYARITRSE